MKTLKLLSAMMLVTSVCFAQPNGTPGPTTTDVTTLSRSSWYRGGNLGPNTTVSVQGPQNIFGTFWNSGIYTYTNSIFRMVLNGNKSDIIIGGPLVNTTGFLGLGTQTPFAPLHIGEDLPAAGQGGGYRPWMTLGTLTMFGSDNVYVGLKDEGPDRKDAIFNWGDNPTGTTGSDNLRFIFTSPQTQSGPGNGANGVEIMHLQSSNQHVGIGPSFTNTSIPNARLEVHDALAGLGIASQFRITQENQPNNSALTGKFADFQVSVFGDLYIRPFNSIAPAGQQNRFVGIGLSPVGANSATEVLDVNGNGRFRGVPAQGGQSLILGLQNGGNQDDVELSRLEFPNDPTQVLIGTGTWAPLPAGNGFTDCADNTGAANLLVDSKVNLNDQNLFFENNNIVGKNLIGIGYSCADPIAAKVNVFSINEEWNSDFLTDNSNPVNPAFQGGIRSDVINTRSTDATGVYGHVSPNVTGVMTTAIGVHGVVDGIIVKEAIGVKGEGYVTDPNSGAIGGRFIAEGSGFGRGSVSSVVVSQLSSGQYSGFGFGSDAYAQGDQVNGAYGARGGSYCTDCVTSVGGTFQATGTSQTHIGIVASATGGLNNFAARFIGDVDVVGNITASGSITPSDQMFKTNVADLANSMDLINQLSPKTYDYDTTTYADFNFETDQQMGLIAQEVELILPTIVSNHVRPAQYDSLGALVTPELTYKGVEYEELIPLLIGGMKEQHAEIQSKDSIIDNLNDRLTQLENCLSGILPFLCQLSNSSIEQNDLELQNELIRTINVELSNKENIVLNQNVPNPFAERTVITFSIPESVGQAQIHFYDGTGKLINTVDINERGNGQINVFANDLSTGVYTYSLVADGKIISTKRMVKQ